MIFSLNLRNWQLNLVAVNIFIGCWITKYLVDGYYMDYCEILLSSTSRWWCYSIAFLMCLQCEGCSLSECISFSPKLTKSLSVVHRSIQLRIVFIVIRNGHKWRIAQRTYFSFSMKRVEKKIFPFPSYL